METRLQNRLIYLRLSTSLLLSALSIFGIAAGQPITTISSSLVCLFYCHVRLLTPSWGTHHVIKFQKAEAFEQVERQVLRRSLLYFALGIAVILLIGMMATSYRVILLSLADLLLFFYVCICYYVGINSVE